MDDFGNMFRMIDDLRNWDGHFGNIVYVYNHGNIVYVYNHTSHCKLVQTPAGLYLQNTEKLPNKDRMWTKATKKYEPFRKG